MGPVVLAEWRKDWNKNASQYQPAVADNKLGFVVGNKAVPADKAAARKAIADRLVAFAAVAAYNFAPADMKVGGNNNLAQL